MTYLHTEMHGWAYLDTQAPTHPLSFIVFNLQTRSFLKFSLFNTNVLLR